MQSSWLDADGRDADVNLCGDSADDAEQRDDAAGDAEPQAESDDAADDARNAEPDGDDSQARDDSQATLHLMSPVPADDAELNGEPDDATDDAADDAELNGEPDDPHDFAERLIDEAHVRLILQMSGYRGLDSPGFGPMSLGKYRDRSRARERPGLQESDRPAGNNHIVSAQRCLAVSARKPAAQYFRAALS